MAIYGHSEPHEGIVYIPEIRPERAPAPIYSTPSPPQYFPPLPLGFPIEHIPKTLGFFTIKNNKKGAKHQEIPKTKAFSDHPELSTNKKRKWLNIRLPRIFCSGMSCKVEKWGEFCNRIFFFLDIE